MSHSILIQILVIVFSFIPLFRSERCHLKFVSEDPDSHSLVTIIDTSNIFPINSSFTSEFHRITNQLEYSSAICRYDEYNFADPYKSCDKTSDQIILYLSDYNEFSLVSWSAVKVFNKVVFLVYDKDGFFQNTYDILSKDTSKVFYVNEKELSASLDKVLKDPAYFNSLATLKFNRLQPNNSKTGALLMSIITVVVFSCFLFKWMQLNSRFANYRIYYHSIFEFVLFAVIVRNGFMIYYIFKYDHSAEAEYLQNDSSFVMVSIKLLAGLTRALTLIWYINLIYGIGIYRSHVVPSSIRKLLLLFLFLFVAFMVDPLIPDLLSITLFYGFDFGDLRSLVILPIIQIGLFWLLVHSVRQLNIRALFVSLFTEIGNFVYESLLGINFNLQQLR